MAQGTLEWKMRRLGKATGSRIFEIVDTDSKGGYKSARANLLYELAMEIITNDPAEKYVNSYMREGTRQEPIARVAYSLEHDADIDQIDFIDHPRIARSGVSPDGLVGDDGFVEFKCRQMKYHIEFMVNQKVPPEYLCQIGWQFACMPERQWCDYVSFCDRMPFDKRLAVKRILRADNEKFIARLETEVSKFVAELDQHVVDLKSKLGL